MGSHSPSKLKFTPDRSGIFEINKSKTYYYLELGRTYFIHHNALSGILVYDDRQQKIEPMTPFQLMVSTTTQD